MAEEKKEEKSWVHSYQVKHGSDYDTKQGVQHLREDLSSDETKVLLEQARAKGEAKFQDENKKNFKVKYDYATGQYSVEKRENE